MVLRGTICIIFIYLLFYMAGFLFSQITRLELLKSKIVYGSVLIISIFEIISFPFLIIKNHFLILCYIFGAVIVALLCSALYFWVKNKEWKNIYVFHVREFWSCFFPVVFFLIVFLQIYMVSYMHLESYDDGYYIAISNMALEQNVVELNDKVVYAGNDILEAFNSRPGINCWELLIAFFAGIFAIHPAVLAHTFLPVLIIPLCYLAVDQVMKKMTDNTRDRFLCMFIYSLLIMFYGNGRVLSPYLVVETWVGKALLFHLVIPLLLSECIDIIQERQTNITWIKIGIIAVVGAGVTATGIYTVPVYLFSIAIPYILYLAYKHRLSTIFYLLKYAVCSLSVFIMIGIYAVAEMINSGRNETLKDQGFNIRSLYTRVFVQDRIYIILFMAALVLLVFRENSKRKKLLFTGQTIILFLLVLNPVNSEFIAKYITGISVYWRMFLLLPVSFLIPLSGKYVLSFVHTNKKWINHVLTGLVSVFFVVICVSSGKGMFSIYSEHQNIYMIPDEILDICKSFDLSSKEMITVLVEDPLNRYFRQYSSYFDVVVGRSTAVARCEKEEQYKAVCQDIFEEGKIDEITDEYLKTLGVEYIISAKPLANTEWILCKKIDNYFIYESIGNKKHFIGS